MEFFPIGNIFVFWDIVINALSQHRDTVLLRSKLHIFDCSLVNP